MTISFSAESFGRDGFELAAPNAAPADDTDYLAGDGTWKTIPAGGASVATDPIWDAVGDLAIGSGNNTSVRLPRGTANQVLRVNSAGTNIEWVTDEVTQAELDSIAASLLNHLNDSLDAHAASAISYNAGTVASALTALESETLDWGNIGGTIGDQTDLIALVATKQDADANLDTWATVTPGTGVAAALAIDIGQAGAPIVLNGDAGTPSAIVLTNGINLPAAGVIGTAAILGANVFTGQQILSVAGLASTPPLHLTGAIFTGGSATTTKPQLLIEPTGTTSTNWSTAGTLFGGNAGSGFTGNFFDFQRDGSATYVKANLTGIYSRIEPYRCGYLNAGETQFTGDQYSGGQHFFYSAGSAMAEMRLASIFQLSSNILFGWTSGSVSATGFDLTIGRDAAGIMAQRNGANAQKLRVYGSADGTPGSNYIAAGLSCSATAVTLAVDALGSFASGGKDIELTPYGTGRAKGMNGFAVPCLVTDQTAAVLHIKSTTGTGTEPIFQICRSGSESVGIGIRSNGVVQFLGAVSYGTNGEILLDGNTYSLSRGTAHRLKLGGDGDSTDRLFTFNANNLTNASSSHLAKTSTTNGVTLTEELRTWVDDTHASRKGRAIYNVYDTAARECMRMEASGTAAMLSFFGAPAVVQQVLATGAGATVDNVITLLQTLGLCRQS